MPNTLVHLGVQTLGTRALMKGADFKWIAVGCIIPDVPWIVQRVLLSVGKVNPYDLLHYVTVQASLFGCLILSGALALLAGSSGRMFLLLALNSLLHLLLDAMQIKWANGVHFLAPFSWQMTGFNLLWPEHVITYGLTLLGFLVLVYYGSRDWKTPVVLAADRAKYGMAVLLLAAYFAAPLFFSGEPYKANNHYVHTLLNVEQRPGKYLELDRSRFRSRDNTVRMFSGERFKVQGVRPDRDAVISVQGYFVDKNTIHISAMHVHSPLRDISTKFALGGIILIWLVALVKKRITVELSS